MNRIKTTLTYGNVIATLALFLALGGSALAVSTVSKNTVVSRSIKDAAVRGVDVKDDSLTGADIDEGSLNVKAIGAAGPAGPAGTAGGPGTPGAAGMLRLGPNSIGSEEVKPESLTSDDVQEGSFGQVPVAALGGTGRYGFIGSCNPEGPTFVSCASVDVTVASQSRLLVIGTVRAHVEGSAAKFSVGDCRIGTSTGPIDASLDGARIASDGSRYANLTLMAVTDTFLPGTHAFGVECNQAALTAAGIEFEQARVTAVALSAN
jgi:hypothetical protein